MCANSNRVAVQETTIMIQSESLPPLEIHSVCLPPKKTSFQKFKHRLSEIFFPDDPFYRFKNQTILMKFILGLQYLFPILQWGPTYTLSLLKSDIISGLTIASLAIPQGISYAKLANLPPIIGLYSSFVPPLIYAILGSSRHLAVGPVSIASLVMGSMLDETVPYAEYPALYLQLAFTATFFAGLFQASLGLLRLGFIIDFLSKATLIGFMGGAAIIVSLQQLKGFLGIVHFTDKMEFIPVMSSVFHHTNELSWQTIVMGLGFLVFLLVTRHISMRKPNLFWVSAAAPLTSVILSTLLVFFLRDHVVNYISTIGHIQQGLNPPSANMFYFHGPYLALTVKTGIITGILSLTEGIAVGRTFASLKNYQVDGNKEMMAIGMMNMAGSCSSCYVTTGSFSRSAVNYNAGAQSAFSNIVMAATVLVTLLFLMPLFKYTPNVVLAAIIITAVIGLIDYRSALKLWKVDRLDFLACLCAFFGVLFISVQIGLAIAIGISIFKILLHVTRPNTVVLGNIPGTQIYQNLSRYGEAKRIPSFLILGIESPIYFANSTYVQERVLGRVFMAWENTGVGQRPYMNHTHTWRILRWIREEEDRIQVNKGSSIKCLILDMTAVTAIDSSGIETINELKKMVEKQSLQLVLANPAAEVMEKLHQSNILESFGTNGLYLTVGEAVAAVSLSLKGQPSTVSDA